MIDHDELKKWLKVQRGEMLALYEAMGHDSAYGAAKALELTLNHLIKQECVHEWISGRYMVKHCRKCGEFYR